MQGHFEGTQPSPYASISVNNPSRYTNSNLVNRRYMEQAQQQQQQSQNPQVPIKPVIPRRRTANNHNNSASGMTQQIQMQPSQNQMIQPSTSNLMNQAIINQDGSSSDIIRTPSPVSHTPNSTTPLSQQDIKPNLQNLNLPQYNGTMPLVTNIPNMEIATLFTMSFNQNFQNHNN